MEFFAEIIKYPLLVSHFVSFVLMIAALLCLYVFSERIDPALKDLFKESETGRRLLKRIALFISAGVLVSAILYLSNRTDGTLVVSMAITLTVVFAALLWVFRSHHAALADYSVCAHERKVGRVYLGLIVVGYLAVYIGMLWEMIEDLRHSTPLQPLLTAAIFWLTVLHFIGLAHRTSIRRNAGIERATLSGT